MNQDTPDLGEICRGRGPFFGSDCRSYPGVGQGAGCQVRLVVVCVPSDDLDLLLGIQSMSEPATALRDQKPTAKHGSRNTPAPAPYASRCRYSRTAPSTRSRTRVTAADKTSEPRQPSRLLKKRNT